MYVAVGVRSPLRHVVRVAQADASPTIQSLSTPVPSSGPPPIHLSTSARSLIGSLTVIGAIFLAFVAWKIRSSWKRKKARTVPARLSIVYKTSEKPTIVSLVDSGSVDGPSKAALQPPVGYSPAFDWAARVKLPTGVTVPPIAVTAASRSPRHQSEYPPTPRSGPSVPPFPSPPPTYRVLGLQTVPLPPPPPDTATNDIPPPTPMSRKFSEPTSTPLRESFDLPPVPSPRSASFNTSTTAPPVPRTTGIPAVFAPKALPRLMVVSTAFHPTRNDELGVRAGETLRLLKEFEDEWCLVQRVGRPDADKGVVPRFCLADRPRVIKGRLSLSNLTFNGVRRK
ncbi:hypothetical protein EDB85DRAFT_1885687 [Lactarius pseudohatsudake]|nr:hypothetical protein EDB85DRAFT_1885687 [Lactarius pseudohatsudake]